MTWANMALCRLHDHINRAKHYPNSQAKPGFPHFADGVAGELDVLDIITLANKFVILLSCVAWYHIRGAYLILHGLKSST